MRKTKKEDVPYCEKVGLPLDNDDGDLQCIPGQAPKMTRAELALYHRQVYESGVSNHQI